MNNSLFSFFMPKEPKFFPLFDDLADIIVDSGDLLVKCLSSSSYEEASKIAKQIKEKEREADRLSQHIFDELNTTFITPFDREDIHDLTDALETVTDGINACAKVFLLYHVDNTPNELIDLAQLVEEASQRIKEVVSLMGKLQKNPSSAEGAINELYRIESEADNICGKFIEYLFKNETDPKELIKLKDIAIKLEEATDLEKIVAKVIKTIIIKYT